MNTLSEWAVKFSTARTPSDFAYHRLHVFLFSALAIDIANIKNQGSGMGSFQEVLSWLSMRDVHGGMDLFTTSLYPSKEEKDRVKDLQNTSLLANKKSVPRMLTWDMNL